MAFLNPYLNFNGNAEEAFDFYKSVFGTEYQQIMRFKDMPAEHQAGDAGEKIMHISLPIGGGSLLMGSDVPGTWGRVTTGTNFYISITAESKEEADKLFNGLAAGGQVVMPMEKAFWGCYFGMLKDKYAVQWMLSYDLGQQQ